VERPCPITGEEPGSGRGAGRESEAAVVPVEPQDNTTCGEGRAAASFTHELGGPDRLRWSVQSRTPAGRWLAVLVRPAALLPGGLDELNAALRVPATHSATASAVTWIAVRATASLMIRPGS